MPVASPERLRILDTAPTGARYNNHATLIGPVIDVQGGDPLTGGAAFDEIVVTNLDDSGVGSLRQACADMITAGGAWIRFAVSGPITLASDIVMVNPRNVTIDGRGQAIVIEAFGLVFSDTTGGSGNGNIFLCNFEFDGVTGTDALQFFSDEFDMTPICVSNVFVRDLNSTDADEMFDFFIGALESHKDITIAWCGFEHVTDAGKKTFGVIGHAGPTDGVENGDAVRMLQHHCAYGDPAETYRGPNFRLPLFGAQDEDNGTTPYLASMNTFLRWQEDGISVRNGAHLYSDGDTFDARSVGNQSNAADGASAADGTSSVKVNNPREIRNPLWPSEVAYEESTGGGAVATPGSLWPSYPGACTTSAEHDTYVFNRSRGCHQLESSGTLDGSAEDDVDTKTLILIAPSVQTTKAAGSAFDDDRAGMRAGVQIWEPNSGTIIAGATIITGDGQVARTDDQTVTFTCDADVEISENAVVFYEGSAGFVGDPFLATWNYADLSVAAAPPSTGQVVIQ